MNAPQQARTVPVPEDFPVIWEDLGDEQLPWQLETQHLPGQHPRLEFDITWRITTDSLADSFHRFEMPIDGVKARLFNTYVYRADIWARLSPEEMAARGRRMEEHLKSLALRLGESWKQEWLPEVQTHLEAMRSMDVAGAGMAELRSHLDDALGRLDHVWKLAFYLTMGFYFAMSEFDDLYCDLFGTDSAFDSYRALGGLPNKTLELGQALWELSRRAKISSEVVQVLKNEAAKQVIAALERSEQGCAFLDNLLEYLERYGRRTDRGEISTPSWIEDPTPVIRNLQSYVQQPDSASPLLAAERAAQAREAAIAAAREQLGGYPEPVRDEFETWLKAAQAATVLSEDHAYYIDISAPYEVRRLIVEIGRRFAGAGLLVAPNDVFHLSLTELHEAMAAFSTKDCRALVRDRQAELERFRDVKPPKELGTPSPPLPAGAGGSGFFRKFAGVAPTELTEPGTVRGIAGSPGKARGTARVIQSLSEAERLRPGDVLVTATTAPPWTPLFTVAGAVVTDTGGVLSHCAVVAREYGIPAIVGTGNATSTLRDGQVVEVDGDAGIVRVR